LLNRGWLGSLGRLGWLVIRALHAGLLIGADLYLAGPSVESVRHGGANGRHLIPENKRHSRCDDDGSRDDGNGHGVVHLAEYAPRTDRFPARKSATIKLIHYHAMGSIARCGVAVVGSHALAGTRYETNLDPEPYRATVLCGGGRRSRPRHSENHQIRAREDGIAFLKLGAETGCGTYFTTVICKVADLNKIGRAVVFFGGKLVIDWQDE
jgi:hypothetical protein